VLVQKAFISSPRKPVRCPAAQFDLGKQSAYQHNILIYDFTSASVLVMNMERAVFANTLENLQFSAWCIPESSKPENKDIKFCSKM
jgi:hypothetical protein